MGIIILIFFLLVLFLVIGAILAAAYFVLLCIAGGLIFLLSYMGFEMAFGPNPTISLTLAGAFTLTFMYSAVKGTVTYQEGGPKKKPNKVFYPARTARLKANFVKTYNYLSLPIGAVGLLILYRLHDVAPLSELFNFSEGRSKTFALLFCSISIISAIFVFNGLSNLATQFRNRDRENIRCPCGSGLRFRQCHGKPRQNA